jgi:hypothetical protein
VCVRVKKVEDFHFPLCRKKDVFFFQRKRSEVKGKRKEQNEKNMRSLARVVSQSTHDITRVRFKIVFVYVYGDGNYVYNLPCSYRQPSGKGQLLSRRYCKHSSSECKRARSVALLSQGALAVSCKNFKQSK